MGAARRGISSAPDETHVLGVLGALWRQRMTSMQALGAATGLGPTALHAALAALRHRGCLIEEHPHEIALLSTGLSCWRDVIEQQAVRFERQLGRRAIILRQTSSTNDVCWQAAESAAHGLVVLADEQTAGRGRRGHCWVAKAGQSILLSILLQGLTADSCPTLDAMTLLLGLACAEAMEEVLGQPMSIKWPNDLLLSGRKLAGILVEARPSAGAGNGSDLVLGLGINVNQRRDDFPVALRPHATSIYVASGRRVDRLVLVDALLEAIERRCWPQKVPQGEGWLESWKSRCHMLNTTVTVRSGGVAITGRVLDVDPLRGLVVRDGHGGTHFFSAQASTLSER